MVKHYLLGLSALLWSAHLAAQPAFTDGTALLGHVAHSGGCMAITDMDDDGLDDVVQLDYGTHVYVLYQEEDGSFTNYDYGTVDNGSQWGWAIGDLHNDGFKDICSGSSGATHFLSITGRGAYTLSDLDGPDIFTQCMSMGDMNNDGRVDVFACHDDGHPNIWFTDTSGVPINNNSYIDWSTDPTSDMSGNYGSCFTDFDNDGDLDFYIAHCRQGVNNPDDPRRWNRLFVNDGTNHFTDQAASYGVQDHGQSWTTDFGDYDNDGDLDMVTTEHDSSIKLFENDGTGHYTEVTAGSGLQSTTGFFLQGLFRDLDNDGFLDLLVAGGIERYFKGNGDGTFTQVDNLFPSDKDMHSFAFGDLNRDGFEDVYANYGNNYVDGSGSHPDRLWLNTPNGNHFLRVRLQGTTSNRDAIGARVTITGPWGTQIREVRSGESYGLVNSFILSFGLGAETMVPTMTVRWPSGLVETFNDLHADQTLTVVEGTCISPNLAVAADPGPILCTGGDPVTLTASGGSAYLWNTGDSVSSITASQPGAYWVTVQGDGACATQANVNVLLDPDQTPAISYAGNGKICSQDELTLTASPASNYLWSNGSDQQSITVNATGSYTVTVQGTCASFTSEPAEITAYATPPQPVTYNVDIPAAGTAVLSATGDSIVWYDAATGGNVVGTGSPWTTPTVSTNTSFWCADVANYGSDPVNGGPMDNTAAGHYQNNANYYLLFTTAEALTINHVKVYANGAGNRQIAIIDQGTGDVVDGGTYDIPDGESVVDLDLTAPGGGAYGLRVVGGDPELWRDGVGSNPDFPYDLGGLGAITGTNAGSDDYYYFFYDWQVSAAGTSCPSDRAEAQVLVGPTGIADHAGASGFRVFPSPATDHLTVQGDLPAGNLDLRILDLAGRTVLTPQLHGKTIDVSSLAAGTYTLALRDAQGIRNAVFVKQ